MRGVNTRVQRIAFSTVFFTQQRQPDLGVRGLIDGLNRFAGDTQPNGTADLLHMKVVNQHPAGIVAGAIVYYDHLIELIVQLQQGHHII